MLFTYTYMQILQQCKTYFDRKLNTELKRDQLCVQNALSSCGGPDRNLIQKRFNTRVDNLYSQYNRYCLPTTTAVTTSAPSPS